MEITPSMWQNVETEKKQKKSAPNGDAFLI